MSIPPPVPEWTLTARHTHGTYGQLLVGCHIEKIDKHYHFISKDTGTTLAKSAGTKLPTASFTFTPAFDYNGLTGVVIGMKIPVAAGKNWAGSWSCTDSPAMEGPQSGDFTAQAGSGLGEDEVANSAKA